MFNFSAIFVPVSFCEFLRIWSSFLSILLASKYLQPNFEVRGVLRSLSTGLIHTVIGHVMLNNSRTCMVDKLVKIKSTLALVYNQIFRPSAGTAGRRWISCARHSSEGLPLHSQIYYQEYRTNIENHQRFRVQRIFFGPNGLAKEILDDDQI